MPPRETIDALMSANDSRPGFHLGGERDEHVSIRVLGRMHPAAQDYWDGNWLIAPIEVVVGGFRAEIGAGLRAEELVRFRQALESLYATLEGEAAFESLEGWLYLRLVVTRTGGLTLEGRVVDRPGEGNTLSFRLYGLDQTCLPAVISALVETEKAFPVLGNS